MSRTEAEMFLTKKDKTGQFVNQDGIFVVRDCESDKNQFSLSVKHGNSAQHFKILSNAEGNYYLWPNKTFPSINKLIEYHRTMSIARDSRVTILLKDKSEETLFVAQYDFKAESPEEIDLSRGAQIRFLGKSDENWWNGEIVGTNIRGLFPCNYVKPVK